MFRLLKTLGTIITPPSALFLSPRLKMQLYNRKPTPFAVRFKSSGASKSTSSSDCKSKSKNKPEPSCKRTARKKNCSKRRAPTPSYSECRREPTVPKPPSECDCGDFDKC